MNTTKYKTNLRCGKCVAKIRQVLDPVQEIQSWEVDLEHPQKLLEVVHSSAVDDQVPGLLQQAGFEATVFDEQKQGVQGAQGFRLSKYRPLLLVVAYIAGLTFLMEWHQGSFSWTRSMANFMGFFFLGFAFFKLLDVPAFANAFAGYDIIARRSRVYGLAYPFIELLLGLAFLFGVLPLFANIITLLIMSVGLIGVCRAVLAKQTLQCACLGTGFNLPMSFVTIVENGVMILMSATMIWILVVQS